MTAGATDIDIATPAQQATSPRLAVIALLAVCAVGGLLGIRTIVSEDLGYHLAYGERFWSDGEIVDHNAFLYTLPPTDTPPQQRPPAGPGSWYDAQGRYRFANANWLTQVVFTGVYLVGGFTGLNILLMMLVWSFVALVLILMRRLGVAPLMAAAGTLLVLLIAYERFLLRPELVGYVVLLGQAALLAPLVCDLGRRPIGWRAMAGLVALQWVLTNVHSYFLIGLGLTGAVAFEAVVRCLRQRSADGADGSRAALRSNLSRLGLLLGLQVLVCFANPWTWRLVALPIQTMLFLGKHNITQGQSAHPWAWYRELRRTFVNSGEVVTVWRTFLRSGFHGEPTRSLLTVALAVGGAGGIIAFRARRWALLLWATAGVYLGLSMHRNMGVATALMVPAGLAALSAWVFAATGAWSRMVRAIATWAAAGVVVCVCAVLTVLIVTDRVYPPRYQARFGMGRSRMVFPEGPADWLNTHHVRGRIWTDVMTSANLYFLLDPRPEWPTLINAWAYPPAGMARVHASWWAGPQVLAKVVARFDISVAVTRIDPGGASPTLLDLFNNPRWRMVHLDGLHVIFIRRDGPDGDLAEREALTPDTWDADDYVQRCNARESWPAFTMFTTANALAAAGWHDDAATVLQEVVALEPAHTGAWFQLARALTGRAVSRREAGDPQWSADVDLAIGAYRKRLALRDDAETQAALADLLAQFDRR